MFNRKFLSLIFIISFLGACDMQEKKFKNDSDTIKKIVACGLGLAGILVSAKIAFLDTGDFKQSCYFDGIFESDTLTVLCANVKCVPFILVCKNIISFKNGQKAFRAISLFHGACVGVLSYKVLNLFFPN